MKGIDISSFNNDQLVILKKASDDGVDITDIADPKYSAKEMRKMITAKVKEGSTAVKFADPGNDKARVNCIKNVHKEYLKVYDKYLNYTRKAREAYAELKKISEKREGALSMIKDCD